MRIIGGKFKGRKLASFEGREVRPTSDRVREAVFNILAISWEGKVVLDLFAGTGGLGLEALSRGAYRVVFIENHRRTLHVLGKNISSLGLDGNCEVVASTVEKGMEFVGSGRSPFDVIFLDPPYGRGLAEATLRMLGGSEVLREGGEIIVEHHCREVLEDRYGRVCRSDSRVYGKTGISFYCHASGRSG